MVENWGRPVTNDQKKKRRKKREVISLLEKDKEGSSHLQTKRSAKGPNPSLRRKNIGVERVGEKTVWEGGELQRQQQRVGNQAQKGGGGRRKRAIRRSGQIGRLRGGVGRVGNPQ